MINTGDMLMDCIALHEGLASARKRYVDTEVIHKETFDLLVEIDPSPTKKYLEWMCGEVLRAKEAGHVLSQYIFDMEHTFKKFYELSKRGKIENTDINVYDNIVGIADAVEAGEREMSVIELRGEAKKGAKKIYNSDRFLMLRIDTHASSKMYGAGTRWCISTRSPDQFNSYVDRGNTFYFLISKATKEKVALTVGSDGRIVVYLSNDSFIDKQDLLGTEVFSPIEDDDELEKILKLAVPNVSTYEDKKQTKRWNDLFVEILSDLFSDEFGQLEQLIKPYGYDKGEVEKNLSQEGFSNMRAAHIIFSRMEDDLLMKNLRNFHTRSLPQMVWGAGIFTRLKEGELRDLFVKTMIDAGFLVDRGVLDEPE